MFEHFAPLWLWPIPTAAAVGGLVDFLIGRVGQRRARAWLEEWWIRFDDVHWNNFGKKEAEFAINVIDKYFGKRLFSCKRVAWSTSIVVVCSIIGLVEERVFSEGGWPYAWHEIVFMGAVSLILFASSISITRLLSVCVRRTIGDHDSFNLLVFVLFLIITYCLLAHSRPMTVFFSYNLPTITYRIVEHIQEINLYGPLFLDLLFSVSWDELNPHNAFRPIIWIFSHPAGPVFTPIICIYFASLARLAAAVIFIGSFLVKPILMRPLSLVWRRLVESEHPVFAMIFGGTATVAVFIDQFVTRL